MIMYTIRKKEIVAEIQSGMTDEELMKKHNLPLRAFQRLMQVLVGEGYMERSELYEKSVIYRDLSDILTSRRYPRMYVPFSIRARNERSSQKGVVLDISESGLRIAGIDAAIGDEMTLRLPMREVEEIKPLRLGVVCRWSSPKDTSYKYQSAGFEIGTFYQEGKEEWLRLLEYGRMLP